MFQIGSHLLGVLNIGMAFSLYNIPLAAIFIKEFCGTTPAMLGSLKYFSMLFFCCSPPPEMISSVHDHGQSHERDFLTSPHTPIRH